ASRPIPPRPTCETSTRSSASRTAVRPSWPQNGCSPAERPRPPPTRPGLNTPCDAGGRRRIDGRRGRMFDPTVIPRVPPGFQPTPAALDALDSEASVLLVRAPPGYGKTATVATWLERGPERLTVWADAPIDSDGERFLTDVGQRLEQADEFGHVVRDLSHPGP